MASTLAVYTADGIIIILSSLVPDSHCKEGESLAKCHRRVFPGALYSVPQSDCSIVSCDITSSVDNACVSTAVAFRQANDPCSMSDKATLVLEAVTEAAKSIG